MEPELETSLMETAAHFEAMMKQFAFAVVGRLRRCEAYKLGLLLLHSRTAYIPYPLPPRSPTPSLPALYDRLLCIEAQKSFARRVHFDR